MAAIATVPAIAVIGGGQMARALIGGWLRQGIEVARIAVADPSAAQRDWLAAAFKGLALHSANDAAAATAGVWLFAVKPQQLAVVARGLQPLAAAQRPLVISIAAGIRRADLDGWLGGAAAVVRAMPNRPALNGAGITALYAGESVPAPRRVLAATLLEAVGPVVWLTEESQLDAVTAVSGSGPAYFFRLIELLEAAAIEQGLPQPVARQLAIETAHGAATMARESSDDPATLRAQVTSPGGTTAAALAVFEAADLRGIVARAVAAAAGRARELADEYGRPSAGGQPG